MKEKLIYECDYCGKTFEDYDECDRHEMEEMARRCEYDFTLYDEHGEIGFNPSVSPEFIMAIWCDGDRETIDLIERYFQSHCWDAPPLEEGKEVLLVVDDWMADWCDINEATKHYNELKEKFTH